MAKRSADVPRVLVLGANGQVGHELLRFLAPVGEVVAATRRGQLAGGARCHALDLLEVGAARALIEQERPTVVVNAAAYTAVDRAEAEPHLAARLNGDALSEIGEAAEAVGARVVHYSTDYVFSGGSERPYREDDTTAPESVYGRSKLAGELALAASGVDHMVFRTAWVYSTRGQNFMRTMLRLAVERDEVGVVDDQRGTPTPAFLIAAVTAFVLARWPTSGSGAAAGSGTYNLCSDGETTWCGFAEAIFERAKTAGLLARVPRVRPIATADYPTDATRPRYSVLDTNRLRSAYGVYLPHWTWGLDRVVGDLVTASQ